MMVVCVVVPGVHRQPYRDDSMTVAILAAVVTLLAMLVLLLLALLLRKRRLHEPKISHCTQTYNEVAKRPPKETNLAVKNNQHQPLVRHASYSPSSQTTQHTLLLNNTTSSTDSFRKSL